jgi:hypothetical protein
MRPWKSIVSLLALSGLPLLAGPAHAGKAEASDLKRQIDSQRAAVSDLERLDEQHKVQGETTLLRSWLDEADAQHAKEKFDEVRLVLDRCIAQSELVRQKTLASKLVQRAEERERAATASRDKLEATKKALAEAQTTKKALEMNAK